MKFTRGGATGVPLRTAKVGGLRHPYSVVIKTVEAVNTAEFRGFMRYLSNALVLVALLGIGAASASAQQPRDVPAQTVSSPDNRESSNWGWIGLVGLVGLAGMMRKESHARHTVRTDAQPSTSR